MAEHTRPGAILVLVASLAGCASSAQTQGDPTGGTRSAPVASTVTTVPTPTRVASPTPRGSGGATPQPTITIPLDSPGLVMEGLVGTWTGRDRVLVIRPDASGTLSYAAGRLTLRFVTITSGMDAVASARVQTSTESRYRGRNLDFRLASGTIETEFGAVCAAGTALPDCAE